MYHLRNAMKRISEDMKSEWEVRERFSLLEVA